MIFGLSIQSLMADNEEGFSMQYELIERIMNEATLRQLK